MNLRVKKVRENEKHLSLKNWLEKRKVEPSQQLTVTVVSNASLCCRSDPKMSEEKRISSSSSAEEVGEAMRHVARATRNMMSADLTGAPSSSGLQKEKKKKPTNQNCTDSEEGDENLEAPRAMVRTGKVTRRGRVTSTHVTVRKSIMKRKTRRRKSSGMRSKRPSVSELNLVKRNLDEGLRVELSPSSYDLSQEKLELEFESTGSSLREAISNGALNTVDEVGASDIQPKRDLPAKYSNSLSNERDLPAKYYNSADNDDERDLPAKYYNPADNDDE